LACGRKVKVSIAHVIWVGNLAHKGNNKKKGDKTKLAKKNEEAACSFYFKHKCLLPLRGLRQPFLPLPLEKPDFNDFEYTT
jgi:hypothetical protein